MYANDTVLKAMEEDAKASTKAGKDEEDDDSICSDLSDMVEEEDGDGEEKGIFTMTDV